MPKRRLLGQLSPSFLLLTTTAIAIVCWYAIHALDSAAIDAARGQLTSTAELVGRQWAAGPTAAKRQLLADFCRDLATDSVRCAVVSTDGSALLGDRRAGEQESWLELP